MKFNIGAALSTGVKAFEETGNPFAAAGAAAVGGFAAGSASPVQGDTIAGSPTAGSPTGGIAALGGFGDISSLLEEALCATSGATDPLQMLAGSQAATQGIGETSNTQSQPDYAGLITGDDSAIS